MFHTVNFTKTGGFPLTQNAMEYIQQSYNDVLEAVARMAGQYVIVTGVTETAPNVYSNGWVAIEGQFMPFIGGVNSGFVSITPAYSGLTFRDGSTPIVYTSYTATFGVSGIPFGSFKYLTLESLKAEIDAAATTANNALALALAISAGTQSFTAGMIMMWSGNPAAVPSGWGLCDGLDGRPNLKGRFIAGYDAGDPDYNAIGDTGGAKTVTLSIAQMPSHTHGMSSAGAHTHGLPGTADFAAWINNEADAGSGSSGNEVSGTPYPNTDSQGSHTHAINSTGDGGSHENRPPYYTLAYIIKL